MRHLSLKLRLMLIFAAVSVLTFAAAGYLSLKETKESIDEFFDTYQMALARNLSSVDWQHMNSAIKKQTDKNLKHIRNADDDDDAIGFAVFNLEGQRVFDDNEKGLKFGFNGNIGAFQTEIIDDEPWRVVRIKSADDKFIIAVGQELDYRDDMAWDMTEEFMLPWMWGLGLLLLIILIAVSYEFKPLKNLIGNIKNRSPEDLSAIPTDKLPSEIVPLVNSLNGLLAKIEKMLTRERRFVADAAHELRTPLTALQVQLEVLEMSDDDAKARKKAADNLSQGLKRAAHLVEQLLALSRLDVSLAAGQTDKEPIDWKHLAQAVCNEYQAAAAEKNITVINHTLKEGPLTEANKDLAATVIKNLLENAIKYSPEGAEIEIESKPGILTVTNSGVKVAKEHLSKLAQRFYRPSGQNEKGSGLGLSIVKSITDFYGCELLFTNTDKGFKVTIKK